MKTDPPTHYQRNRAIRRAAKFDPCAVELRESRARARAMTRRLLPPSKRPGIMSVDGHDYREGDLVSIGGREYVVMSKRDGSLGLVDHGYFKP